MYILESGAMGGGGKAGGASVRDNEVSTGPRAPWHPDQYEQSVPYLETAGQR
jgi:hypothetical protein